LHLQARASAVIANTRCRRLPEKILKLIACLSLCFLVNQSGQVLSSEPEHAVADSVAEQSALEIRGDSIETKKIGSDELAHLSRADLRVNSSRAGAGQAVYTGPSLFDVLRAGGIQISPGMKGLREVVSKSVIVEGADGYRAVFSLAELDPDLSSSSVLLADTIEGQPLSSQEGPYRVIVPGDKHAARWVRQVRVIVIRVN
jgi:DMSO/TMAO reductase YedYZ molybdopterin-dependent catalytic subunit